MKVNLMDRTHWSLQPWLESLPPAVVPDLRLACAVVAVFPAAPRVEVYVNHDSQCDLWHLPEAITGFVRDYAERGPDAGWDAIPGGHVTAVAASDVHGPSGQQRMTRAELEATLLTESR